MHYASLDDCERLADTIIDGYERVLGIEFGERPAVRVGDKQAYTEFILRTSPHYREEASPKDLEMAVNMFRMLGAGIYDDTTHTVLISEFVLEEPELYGPGQLEYTMAHELAHALQANVLQRHDVTWRMPGFREAGTLSYSDECEMFTEMAVMEGFGEYAASTLFNAIGDEGQMQAAGRAFAENKCAKYATMADEFPGKIVDIVAYRDAVEAGTPAEELGPRTDTKENQYRIGYGYIAGEVARGRSVEDILAHPPQHPEDMLSE